MTHTPGPWVLSFDLPVWSGSIAIVTPDSEAIAHTTRGWGETVQSANARLIAAAPEMLEALKDASGLAVCCMSPGCYSHDELAEMARATKPIFDAAITKALGQCR